MPDHSGRATDSTAPEDRVPLAEKLGDGLGTLVDLWGHWLYPNLATQVFNIYLGVSPALVSLALMINRLVSAASDPLFSRLSDNARTRFGRRRPFILVGAVLAGFGLQLLFLVSPGWGATRLHFIASGSIALASAGYWMLDGSIGADIMDNDELESGTRREGAFSACGSWVTKGGIAAGIGASGFILAATGFDSKLGGAQAAHTHLMIRLFLAGVPIVGLACAPLVLSRYSLTQERMFEIRALLERRRWKF